MNINIPALVDIVAVSANQQLQTDARLMRENQRCTLHDCAVGQQVCVNNHFSSADELKPVWVRPFPFPRVHANGTVTVQCGQTHEQISIHRVKPVPAQNFTFPAELSGLGASCISGQVWQFFGTVFLSSVVE